jgi:hypothetical protein
VLYRHVASCSDGRVIERVLSSVLLLCVTTVPYPLTPIHFIFSVDLYLSPFHSDSCSDASRSAVDQALFEGSRIGIVPGGIAEMFEGYPKPSTLPHEEYSIVRKGFLRLAVKHGVPVIPVYVFGATKMFKRLQLPVLERLSLFFRVSLVVFFGAWGLPIPFRQRLLYVMGQPIMPSSLVGGGGGGGANMNDNTGTLAVAGVEQQVDDMHARFCDELLRLFDRHKESYGWGHKTLKLLYS